MMICMVVVQNLESLVVNCLVPVDHEVVLDDNILVVFIIGVALNDADLDMVSLDWSNFLALVKLVTYKLPVKLTVPSSDQVFDGVGILRLLHVKVGGAHRHIFLRFDDALSAYRLCHLDDTSRLCDCKKLHGLILYHNLRFIIVFWRHFGLNLVFNFHLKF